MDSRKKNEKDNAREKKLDLKKAGKAAAHTAAGAALAGSLFLGSLFSAPSDLVKPEEIAPPPAIVQVEETPSAEEELTVFSEDVFEKRTWKDKLREALQKLPLAVRILLLTPMWAVGYGIIWGVSLLAGLISLPIIGPIIKFIIGLAVVFGLLLLGLKALFPKTPLKKLLTKRNLATLLACSGLIALAGALGGVFWSGKPHITALIDICAAALCFGVIGVSVLSGRKKAGSAG